MDGRLIHSIENIILLGTVLRTVWYPSYRYRKHQTIIGFFGRLDLFLNLRIYLAPYETPYGT